MGDTGLAWRADAEAVTFLQTTVEVTFSASMGSDPYTVLMWPSNGIVLSLGTLSKSATGFTCNITAASAGMIMWLAIRSN